MKNFKFYTKIYLNYFLKFFNLRISSYQKDNLSEIVIGNILSYFKVDMVLDVGANKGQFAEMIINNNYSKKIISVEPVQSAHLILINKSKRYSFWTVCPIMAIGNDNSIIKFYETLNSQCSSKKKPIKNKLDDYHIINTFNVKQTTLKDFYKDNILEDYNSICLKIDTQGNELEILKSGKNILNKFRLIIIEISFDIDYEGQNSFMEIINYLLDNNFFIWSVQKVYEDISIGKTSYLDLIFTNKNN